MYEGGCLLFREERTGTLLHAVWPTGSTFNGTAVTFHRPGKLDQPIIIGEQLVIYGHPVSWPALGGYYAPFQRQCGGQPFLVGMTRPAN